MNNPTPEQREQLRLDLAVIVAAHAGSKLELGADLATDSPTLYKVSCGGTACDWHAVVTATHANDIHPAHVAHMLEPRILQFAEAVKDSAAPLEKEWGVKRGKSVTKFGGDRRSAQLAARQGGGGVFVSREHGQWVEVNA